MDESRLGGLGDDVLAGLCVSNKEKLELKIENVFFLGSQSILRTDKSRLNVVFALRVSSFLFRKKNNASLLDHCIIILIKFEVAVAAASNKMLSKFESNDFEGFNESGDKQRVFDKPVEKSKRLYRNASKH